MRDVYFRDGIEGAIKGVRRAMLESNNSDDYKKATMDFAAALSDVFGIGEIDGQGDLYQIGHPDCDLCARAIRGQQSGDHATVRTADIWPRRA